MNPRSPAFIQFAASYRELSKIYLNRRPSPTPPTDIELEKTRAFVTFFHAELENYFETVCETLLNETEARFRSGNITDATLSLITFSKLEDSSSGDAIIPTPKGKYRTINDRFYKAKIKHQEKIDKNHGLSQGYLAVLFTPLGLTNQNIDPAWVSELQNLADLRGGYAHKSRKSVDGKPGHAPATALKNARKIIFGVGGRLAGANISSLVDFDKWAMDFCSSGSPPSQSNNSYWGFKHRFGWWIIRKIGNNQKFE